MMTANMDTDYAIILYFFFFFMDLRTWGED